MTAIKVELQLADGSFTSGMLRAGQTLKSFQKELTRTNPELQRIADNGGNVIRSIQQMDSGAKGFLGTLRDMSIVVGVVSTGITKMVSAANGWAGEIVRVNSEMERLTFQMRAMSTKADPFKDANESVKYLREQAVQMPFSLKAITGAFTKLKATGIDPTQGSLKALADGIAAFGGSDEQLSRVAVAIAQMSGKGVIQMEELRQQLGEHMPTAMRLMARSMGVSVAELTKAISLGTVQSKAALQKFYDELERTYGGSAQRMMQTFSGQMAQLKTNLQNLATDEGGATFFTAIKGQLQDINEFLKGDFAKTIGGDIGRALASFVGYIREGVSWAWKFRDAIQEITVLAGAGLGLLVAGRAVSGFASIISGTARQLGMFAVNMREAMSNINLGISGLRSFSTATTGVQFAAMGTAQAIGAVASSAISIVGVLLALGGTIYFLADRFGYLSDQTHDAYEELLKYGAESRKQAAETSDAYIESLKEQIEAQKKLQMDRMEGLKQDSNGNLVPDESIGRLYLLNKELKKVQDERADIEKRGAAREDAVAMEGLRRRLSDQEEEIRASRARDQAQKDDDYATDLANYKTLHKTQQQITDEYRAANLKRDHEAADARIKLYQGEINNLTRAEASADEDRKRQLTQQITFLQEKINNERQKVFADNESRFGITKGAAPGAGAQAIKSGEKALERLQRDVAGLDAKLHGANDAVAEMNQRIAAGDYGSVEEGGEAVQELHDKLVAATQAKEILDTLTKGDKKAEEDLNRIREKALEKQMDLKLKLAGGDKMTPGEKFQFKLDNGAYQGLGNSIDLIRKSIEDVVKTMDVQGKSANMIGQVLRENTFGQQTVTKIKSVTEALLEMSTVINGIGTGLNGISFANFGAGAGGAFKQFSGDILELIGKGESGGDYNKTLDNGRWTGGQQNLISMTLDQIRDLQRQMLANPENRAKYGDGKGSSALGKYQITGQTLEGLMKTLGLTGKELFSPEMQDRLAVQLLNGRQGQGLAGLRNEWTSLKNVPDDVILKALQSANNGPTRERAAGYQAPAAGSTTAAALSELPAIPPQYESQLGDIDDLLKQRVERTKQLHAEAQKVVDIEKDNGVKQAELNKKTYLDDLVAKTKNAGTDIEDLGKNYKALVDAVSKGKLNPKNTDINSDEYKDLVKAAKELDQTEDQIAQKKKAGKEADRQAKDLEQERAELNRRIAEEAKKAADPNYKPDSSALQNLTSKLDEYVENVKRAYGADSQAYKDALAQKTAALQQQRQLEATTDAAAFAKHRRDIQQSLMSETQARAQAMQDELAQVDAWVERARQAGMSEVQITQTAEQQKAAIRAKYAAEANPLTKQMQEWGDLQGNLAKASTKWMDSLAGGLTDLIMGTGDLKSVIQGILKDLVNMGLKYIMSGMFGGNKTGGKKSAIKPNAGKGAAKAGGKKGMAAIAHTGGIAGSRSLMKRSISPAAFIGAPKFHTGGIINGPMLKPGEVPIIAKKGEGVFTPEQMEQMGGFHQSQAIQINAPITVNGSAGTPEQNQDLAKRMQKEMETTMRGVVADEVRRQSRPGNFLNSRSRN